MFDVEGRVRHDLFVAAAMKGAAAALLVGGAFLPAISGILYRVGAVVGIGAGITLQGLARARPPAWKLIAVGAATFAASLGLLWLIAPGAGGARLATTQLPGLQIDTPVDGVETPRAGMYYDDHGRYAIDLGDSGEAVEVRWSRAPLPAADDVAAVRAQLGLDARAAVTPIALDLAMAHPHHSYDLVVHRVAGVTTFFACSERTYAVTTFGHGAARLQERMLTTVECAPSRAP